MGGVWSCARVCILIAIISEINLKIKTPTSWNWTSDRRITAKLYSPSLYQLSYCRNLTILIILSINWIPSLTSIYFFFSTLPTHTSNFQKLQNIYRIYHFIIVTVPTHSVDFFSRIITRPNTFEFENFYMHTFWSVST